jgi:hypothetical protein
MNRFLAARLTPVCRVTGDVVRLLILDRAWIMVDSAAVCRSGPTLGQNSTTRSRSPDAGADSAVELLLATL